MLVAGSCVDLSPPWGRGLGMGGEAGNAPAGAIPGPGTDADGTGGMAQAGSGDGTVAAGGASGFFEDTGGHGTGGSTGGETVLSSGGSNDPGTGGSVLVGASGGTGGNAKLDGGGTSGSGGAVATGGMSARGGAAGTGGVPAGGGVPARGGTAIGGAVATGGSVSSTTGSGGATAACGTTKSAFSETDKFNASVSPLSVAGSKLSSNTTFTFSTTGPSSNAALCTNGCAVLAVRFTDGLAANEASSAIRTFSAPTNLVGATISFSYAIDNPAQVPVRVQVYVTGDAPSWRWGAPTTLQGSALATYSAATGFAAETLAPVDDPNGYCASATKIVGLQIQNTTAITSATAGTVTIYIASLGISPPA